MQITIDESAYSSPFKPILYSWDRYIIAYGGRGSSKTDTFFLKYLLGLFEPYYFKLAFINKEFSNIRDQQYAGFKRVAKRIGVYDSLKFYDGDYRIVNPKNDNSLIPKGMDDAEKTKGFDSITAIWWDEINKGTLADFQSLNELLRSPEATYLQFAMSFNPVYEKHWLRDFFFDENDPHALHRDFKADTLLHRSTYKDNEFIDQAAYLETLMRRSSGNINALKVNVQGDWGIDEPVSNPFLHAFDELKHVGYVEYNPHLPIIISIDFNLNPFCALFAQQSGKKLWIYDELSIEKGDLFKLADAINARIPLGKKSMLRITGDAMGNRGEISVRDNASNYYQLQNLLGISKMQFDVPANPKHSNSRADCNAALIQCEILISNRCVNTIADFKLVECDASGGIVKKNRKKMEQRADFLDDFRYIINTYMKRYVLK